MNVFKVVCVVASVVVSLSGCSSFGGTAPVEDRSASGTVSPSSSPTGSRSGQSRPDWQAREKTAARATDYRDSRWQEQIARPPAARSISSAALGLIQSADADLQAGRLVEAVAGFERALRIDPGNPLIWQRLAMVRLRQGKYRQAATLAAKSTSLAGNDSQIRAQNWRLIAQARTQLGDSNGARDAWQRARALDTGPDGN
ncbi:MAG: hypothetical protein BMS9Abin26_1860 [Gammaproteobacteria bacterium]|nr:MAG: hypothetical protein BMS9Abin26_1860 [Gammaproteobacteria bacterium]